MGQSANSARVDAMKAFHKDATKEIAEIVKARKDAVGLLTPDLLKKHVASGQDLVLAYGRKGAGTAFQIAGRNIVAKDGYLTLTLPDLKALADAQDKAQSSFQQATRGVPLLLLKKTSDPGDMARSREVRNASLYRFDRNILFFRVSGNSKPHYQVQVRLEEWDRVVTSSMPSYLLAARAAATGRLSIECPCGRHQYWYRYLATIGGFAIAPQERDFPKIRNPGLKGCCCKHVLKVLRVLKSNTIHAVIAKEMARQAKNTGFASKVRSKSLSKSELEKVSRVRGVSRSPQEAWDSMRLFKKQAAQALQEAEKSQAVQDMRKKLKPRSRPLNISSAGEKLTPQIRKKLSNELRDIVTYIKIGKKTKLGTETLNDALKRKSEHYNKFGLSVDDLKNIMKQEGIE